MDQLGLLLVNKLLDGNTPVLALLVVALGYLYWSAMKEIKSLNATLLEQAKTMTKVASDNSAVIATFTAVLDKSTEAQRDLTEAIRVSDSRRG